MRINIWHLGAVLGAAKAAGLDVDNIIAQIVNVFLGIQPASAIPAQIVQEIADLVKRFGSDPIGTGMDAAMGAAVPEAFGVLMDVGFDALGLPKSRKIGNITIVWTVTPPKPRRKTAKKKKSKRRRSRSVASLEKELAMAKIRAGVKR